MRSLHCPTCTARVYFENDRCLSCGTALGFEPGSFTMVAPSSPIASAAAPDAMGQLRQPGGGRLQLGGAAGRSADSLCRSCALTRTRPADGDAEGHRWFVEAEAAKRRLVAQLLDLGLPVVGFLERPEGLGFDLLTSHFDAVTTGHEDGLITVDLAEADHAHRERVRTELGEAYRTVLGHFRHEVGHYYWMVLVRDGGHLDEFRRCFGDERAELRRGHAGALRRARPRRVGEHPRVGLRHHAPLGGLGRDLRPHPPHPRRPPDRGGHRASP